MIEFKIVKCNYGYRIYRIEEGKIVDEMDTWTLKRAYKRAYKWIEKRKKEIEGIDFNKIQVVDTITYEWKDMK